MPPSQNPSPFSISAAVRQTTRRDSPICTLFVVQPLPFTISRGGNFVESRSEEEEGWILAFRSQRQRQQKRQSLINPCLSRPGELTPPPPSSDLRRCLPVEEMGKKAKLTLKIPLPLFPPLRMQKVVVGAAFLRAHAKISPLGHHNRQANICQPLMDPHNGLEKRRIL